MGYMPSSPKMRDMQGITCWYSLVSTSPGWVGVLASPRGIRRLTLPQSSPSMAYAYLELSEWEVSPEPAPGMPQDIQGRLEQYFLGQEPSSNPN